MLIREMSDVHLDLHPMELTPLDTDNDTVLVLCGDIGVITDDRDRLWTFLWTASKRFRAVIYVFGNHETYYGGVIPHSHETVRQWARDNHMTNMFVLENDTVVIDNVAFIGATLWTDFMHSYVKINQARRYMAADYETTFIANGDIDTIRRIQPEDVYQFHKASKQYIFDQVLAQTSLGNKTVVCVHHGVSYHSVHERFTSNPMNFCFVSGLDNEILATEPTLIFHGHVHDVFDYTIGNSRVIANPRGYPGENGGQFNPTLTINL